MRQKRCPGTLPASGVCHSVTCSNSCSSIGDLASATESAGGGTISGRVHHRSNYSARYPLQLATLSALTDGAGEKESCSRSQGKSPRQPPSPKYRPMYIQTSCPTLNGQPNQRHNYYRERDRNWPAPSQDLHVLAVPHYIEDTLELEIHGNKGRSDVSTYLT